MLGQACVRLHGVPASDPLGPGPPRHRQRGRAQGRSVLSSSESLYSHLYGKKDKGVPFCFSGSAMFGGLYTAGGPSPWTQGTTAGGASPKRVDATDLIAETRTDQAPAAHYIAVRETTRMCERLQMPVFDRSQYRSDEIATMMMDVGTVSYLPKVVASFRNV